MNSFFVIVFVIAVIWWRWCQLHSRKEYISIPGMEDIVVAPRFSNPKYISVPQRLGDKLGKVRFKGTIPTSLIEKDKNVQKGIVTEPWTLPLETLYEGKANILYGMNVTLPLLNLDTNEVIEVGALLDSGSQYLVLVTDACPVCPKGEPITAEVKCCNTEMGVWPADAPSLQAKSQRSFSYGSGQYEGKFYSSALIDGSRSIHCHFAGITSVTSSGGLGNVSICGLLPVGTIKDTNFGFIDYILAALSASLPQAIILDFSSTEHVRDRVIPKYSITFGDVDQEGIEVPLIDKKTTASLFGSSFSTIPYYVVKMIKAVFVPDTPGGQRLPIDLTPHLAKYCMIDTGTSFLAVGPRMASFLGKATGKTPRGHLHLHFGNGAELVGYYSDFPNQVQETDMLEQSPFDCRLMIVGLINMFGNILTIDFDANSLRMRKMKF